MATSEELPLEARVVSQPVCCHAKIRLSGHHVALEEVRATPHEDHYIMGVVVKSCPRQTDPGIRSAVLKHVRPGRTDADYVVEDVTFLCWFLDPLDTIADPLVHTGCVIAIHRPFVRKWHDMDDLELHELRVEVSGRPRDRFTRAVVFTLLDAPPEQCHPAHEPNHPSLTLQCSRLLSLLRKSKVKTGVGARANRTEARRAERRAGRVAAVPAEPPASRPTGAIPRAPAQPSSSNQQPAASRDLGARRRRQADNRASQRRCRQPAGPSYSSEESRPRQRRPGGEATDGVRLAVTPQRHVTAAAGVAASQLRPCVVRLERTALLETARRSAGNAAVLQETAAPRRVGPRPSPSDEDQASVAAAAVNADPGHPGAGQVDAAESGGITTAAPNEPTGSADQRASVGTSTSPSVGAVRTRRPPDSSGTAPAEGPVTDTASTPALDEFVGLVPPCDALNQYTMIADVGRGDPGLYGRPNLMGVVTGTPQLGRQTAKGGYMAMVVIKDPSCATADAPRYDIAVFFFLKNFLLLNEATGPEGLARGTVLRVRNVKIESRNGKLDGRVFSAGSVTFFSSAAGAPLEPLGRSPNAVAVTDAEKARLRWLRDWWRVQRVKQAVLDCAVDTTLCSVVAGLCNLSCEAVWLSPPSATAGAATYLRVRDGTRCRIPCVVARPEAEPGEGDGSGSELSDSEPETQVLRVDAVEVDILVTAGSCVATLRHLQQAGRLKYLQLQRLRAVVEDEGSVYQRLQLSLTAEDEALAVQLSESSPAADTIRHHLAMTDADARRSWAEAEAQPGQLA